MRNKLLPWNLLHLRISTNATNPTIHVLICTNSQSLCQALISGTPRTNSICQSISTILSFIVVQCVPGHCNIPSNDLADTAAKHAATIASDTVTLRYYHALYESLMNCSMMVHLLTFKQRKISVDLREILSFRDDVLVPRLRFGHHLLLKSNLHRIEPAINPMCPSCQLADYTLKH